MSVHTVSVVNVMNLNVANWIVWK